LSSQKGTIIHEPGQGFYEQSGIKNCRPAEFWKYPVRQKGCARISRNLKLNGEKILTLPRKKVN